jgi:hypothetical protein
MHTMRDHQCLVDRAAAVADLLDLGIEKHIWVAALQRPRPERLHVLIQAAQIRLTSLRLILSPRLSTSWSTRLVETPQT